MFPTHDIMILFLPLRYTPLARLADIVVFTSLKEMCCVFYKPQPECNLIALAIGVFREIKDIVHVYETFDVAYCGYDLTARTLPVLEEHCHLGQTW